jgi:hypothetical protein
MKHDEIERLQWQLRHEERTLIKAEKHLTDDIALFDQFLDYCNRSVNDAAHK